MIFDYNFFFPQVIEYILAMTTVKGKTKKDEWKVGLKEKETWPDLRYVFDHSTHCVLLLNDNEHKYDEVENCIKKSLKYPVFIMHFFVDNKF